MYLLLFMQIFSLLLPPMFILPISSPFYSSILIFLVLCYFHVCSLSVNLFSLTLHSAHNNFSSATLYLFLRHKGCPSLPKVIGQINWGGYGSINTEFSPSEVSTGAHCRSYKYRWKWEERVAFFHFFPLLLSNLKNSLKHCKVIWDVSMLDVPGNTHTFQPKLVLCLPVFCRQTGLGIFYILLPKQGNRAEINVGS